MSLINTGSIQRLLMPGLNTIWGAYEMLPNEYSKIFEINNSDKNFETDQNFHYFGLAPVKYQGESLVYDVAGQGPPTYYNHITYALGYIITEEAIEDNLYAQQAKDQTEQLYVSMDITKETVAANVLNNFSNSAVTYYDGLSLGNTAHLLTGGGTYSNTFANPTPLSELAIEQALIQIAGFQTDRGLIIKAMGELLIVPRQLQFEAKRILGGYERYGTANRDINAMKAIGSLGGGDFIINHYLTSSVNWFIKTNIPKGLRLFQRTPRRLADDTDFDTRNFKCSARERFSVGCTDPRGIFCVTGL